MPRRQVQVARKRKKDLNFHLTETLCLESLEERSQLCLKCTGILPLQPGSISDDVSCACPNESYPPDNTLRISHLIKSTYCWDICLTSEISSLSGAIR